MKSTAYLALVRPLLEYASSAWDPSTKQNIKSLERVQRQAARFCTSNYSREEGTVTKALKDLGWESLQTRRRNQRLGMLYKMKNGLVDIPLYDYVQPNPRETRGNNQKFLQLRHKARAYQDSFFVSTIKDWNNLPTSIVSSPSLTTFKNNLLKHSNNLIWVNPHTNTNTLAWMCLERTFCWPNHTDTDTDTDIKSNQASSFFLSFFFLGGGGED